MLKPLKPTKEQIAAAHGKLVPDVIAPELHVLFCGINPGLYTAATGHHFARPGNRFWPTLYRSGFTPRLFFAEEEQLLLPLGYGITNFVARATAAAAELTPEELQLGAKVLAEKLEEFKPEVLAVLGISAYRVAFNLPKAKLGPQPHFIAGAQVWVLPNPSGLNAHFPPNDLAKVFSEFRRAISGFKEL